MKAVLLLLAGLLLVLLPHQAKASMLAVPMCSPNAESVAAPPIEWPLSGDELREWYQCSDAQQAVCEPDAQPDSTPHTSLVEVPDPLLSAEHRNAWPRASSVLALCTVTDIAVFVELGTEVFRPPRA
jgi:hypothetical protein